MDIENVLKQALLTAFASGHELDELKRNLPEYEERIFAILKSMVDRIEEEEKGSQISKGLDEEISWIEDPFDIPKIFEKLNKIGLEKDEEIKNQRFQEAARLRDREKIYHSILNTRYEYKSYEDSFNELVAALDMAAAEEQGMSPISFIIDPGSASPEQVGELLSEISILYRMIGGSGITFEKSEVRKPEVA